ncbi:HlyD family efflux transporter periplasmic adaptor subunit [Salicibibacter cibi]|uniref:HlyD family efflux transporter periplasmic adaptor subunit n=1 Tax=Salicibibacter cibi TaxID=2743001 RepID=A0A7T7CFD9_9BACI|nr:HlyD family efflux transporter periplasmic adaptor subunit [Salicibibacter cibi]QQK80030.1 HlyD family efflux transporter periplasmic adaptor subunit [Salicibibacter cibi]
MKKRMALLIGLLIVIAVVGINTYILSGKQASDSETIETITATEEDMYESIVANGIVEPQSEQRVYQETQHGDIEEIHVEAGDDVSEGDLLLSYEEEDEVSRQIVTIENGIDRLNLEVEQQTNQIANLETQIANAERDGEPDEVIEQYEQERDDLLFQQQLSNQEMSEQEEELEYYQDQQSDTHEVYSDVDGVVHERLEVSEAMEGEEPLLHIISDEDWEINGTVSEYDLVRLEEDQDVRVEANVVNDEDWEGTMVELGTAPADEDEFSEIEMEEDSATNYPFTVQLDEEAPELVHGFHTNVFIDVEAAVAATVIPAEVIQTEIDMESDEEMEYVDSLEDGHVTRQGIETGIRNEQGVQIISGVEPGDEIIIQDEENPVVPGMEVNQDDSTD